MDDTAGTALLPEPGAVAVGRFAAVLAGDGEPALTDALAVLVQDLGLVSAVVRRVDGSLAGAAGELVHAVPSGRKRLSRGPVPVELAVPGRGGAVVATLAVRGARPSQLPTLRAAADVVGIALAAPPTAPAAALLLQAEEQGWDELADDLHDGPLQVLVSARYTADAVVRGADPAQVRDAVQAAVVALRRTLWHLRPRGERDLGAALGALSERLIEGGAGPLELSGDLAALDLLPPAAGLLVFRLVQAASCGTAAPVSVHARREPATPHVRTASGGLAPVPVSGPPDAVLVLDVQGGTPLRSPDRWVCRARGLGGDLSGGAGRLSLALPLRTSPADVHPLTAVPALAAPVGIPGTTAARVARRALTALPASPHVALAPVPPPPGNRPSDPTRALSPTSAALYSPEPKAIP